MIKPNVSARKALLALLGAASLAGSAWAGPVLQNGDFENSSNGPGFQIDSTGRLVTDYGATNSTAVTGWSNLNPKGPDGSASYFFLYAPNTLDTTGAYTPIYNANLIFWSPTNGGTATGEGGAAASTYPRTSPTGGNFVALDGAFQRGPFFTTVTGLIPGIQYDISFYWAAVQQRGYNGATTDRLDVNFGGASLGSGTTQSTSTVNLASHSFNPWQQVTFSFIPTTTNSVLSFLAVGSPDGLPPFALLDGVTITQVPELNASAAGVPVVFAGLLLALGWNRRRRSLAGLA